MAGAGYKLFGAGDILTAAQVNTYLNEQAVMVFATVAARDSALTSVLAEGMTCYVDDITGGGAAGMCVYDGAAWQIMWSEWISMVYDEVFEGITTGNGSWYCKEYRYSGVGMCTVRVGFTFGGTTTVDSTPVFVYPIPVDAVDRGDNVAAAFNVQMKDNSTGNRYPGMLTDFNQNKGRIRAFTAGGTYAASANTSASIPFTWTTSDEIIISGTYPFSTSLTA